MADEKRCLVREIELRAEEGAQPKIQGYAAVFNSQSEDLGGFRETIKRGAFRDYLSGDGDVVALHGHDPTKVIGRRSIGTLQLKEDAKGLAVTISPPDTQEGRDVAELVRSGHLDAMSFGFRTVADSWKTVDGEKVRELRQVDLIDVSVVAYPAYSATEVALRSLEQHEQHHGDFYHRERKRLELAEFEQDR